MCTRCGNKFTVDRWQETARFSWPGEWDRLCGPRAKEVTDRAEAERVARRQAEEAERAAGEAAAVKPRSRFGIGRRRWPAPLGPGWLSVAAARLAG